MGIINYTCNGECSRCGECCSDMLPMTQMEIIRIAKYIQKNKIKPQCKIRLFPEIVADMLCPFFDKTQRKCLVYEVRPDICRKFICSNSEQKIYNDKRNVYNKSGVIDISMHHTFVRDEKIKQFLEQLFSSNPAFAGKMARVTIDWEDDK